MGWTTELSSGRPRRSGHEKGTHPLSLLVAVWHSGNVVVASTKFEPEVTLNRARIVLGWVTVEE